YFFFQAEDGIRDKLVTGVQTCALPIFRRLFLPVLWFVASHVLTVKTPLGRKVRPHVLVDGAPRIRVKSEDLLVAGVERVGKTVRSEERRVGKERRSREVGDRDNREGDR